MFVLTQNFIDRFREGDPRRVYQDINIAIESTISNKVVVRLVQYVDAGKVEVQKEAFQQSNPSPIFLVDVCITTYEQKSIRVSFTQLLKTNSQVC